MTAFRFNFTFAILTSLALLLVLTWLLISLISFKTAENDLMKQKRGEVRILLAAFTAVLTDKDLHDPVSATTSRVATKLELERSFAGLLLIDATGKPLLSVAEKQGADSQLLEVLHNGGDAFVINSKQRIVTRYAAIHGKKGIAGAVKLSLSFADDYVRLKQSQRLLLLYFILDSLLLLVLGAFMLRRSLVIPMRRLVASTERIAAGDYGNMVHVPGSSEIAALSDSFNKMLIALQEERMAVDSHVKSLEQANIELREAREETIRSEKLASVGVLAAGMAHEIGTPLSAIIGYAGILRDELRSDPEKDDYLRRIEQEGNRINRIVRELLNYARPTPQELEPLDLSELISYTLEMLERQGIFKKITPSFTAETDLPRITLDREQMLQVLINLVLNARDAMPDGGKLDISVSKDQFQQPVEPVDGKKVIGRRHDDFSGAFGIRFAETVQRNIPCVRIDIADSGEGIPAEQLGRIFDPFFTTKEPGKGTGLGLSISARIVDSLGGRITVRSSPADGSCFTIWLPAGEEVVVK
jgi:signal transduction histidine kinase